MGADDPVTRAAGAVGKAIDDTLYAKRWIKLPTAADKTAAIDERLAAEQPQKDASTIRYLTGLQADRELTPKELADLQAAQARSQKK